MLASVEEFEVFPPKPLTVCVALWKLQARRGGGLDGQGAAARMDIVEPLPQGVGGSGIEGEGEYGVRRVPALDGQKIADVARDYMPMPAIAGLNPKEIGRPIGSDASADQPELDAIGGGVLKLKQIEQFIIPGAAAAVEGDNQQKLLQLGLRSDFAEDRDAIKIQTRDDATDESCALGKFR
jgi:hypothetical protein